MVDVLSNQAVFYEIALAALDESQKSAVAFTKPKDGGGNIFLLDPERKSFKQALVAIAFSCNFLEAMLCAVGSQVLGNQYNDRDIYEGKLKSLGIDDEILLAQVTRLRTVRKELLHQKVMSVCELKPDNMYFAQDEAESAVMLVKNIRDRLYMGLT